MDANSQTNGIWGSLLGSGRRVRALGALLCLALGLMFGVPFISGPSGDFNFAVFLGGCFTLAIFFLVRAQIRGREAAESALADAKAQEEMLRQALTEMQGRVKASGDAEQAIAHTLALKERLSNVESLHRSLVQTLPFSIFRKDLEGRFIFANEQFCKHVGMTPDKLIGLTDLDLFPVELAAKYRRDDMLVRQSESSLDVIETHQAPEGGPSQYVHVVKTPIYDDHGKLTGVQGVFWDVTERRRAEEKLAAEKERLSVTLRSIGDGVISTDISGKIILMNQVAEELTGWTYADAKGKSIDAVFKCVDPKSREAMASRVGLVLEKGHLNDVGHRSKLISRTGKEILIEDRVASMRDRQRQIIGAVLVFQDITAKLQLESEAAKASRIESIGFLAGGIAHDFNNILTAILGNLSLAKYTGKLTSDVFGRLDLVEKASMRARELTQQLLTFAKGGAPVRQTASLIELIKESTEFALRGSKALASYDLAPDLAPAEIDAGQIHQVMHNLVLNAVQAMPNGGQIKIVARNHRLVSRAEAPLPPGEYVKITVSDDGPGIPADLLPKIFDPYFTTKSGGTGLGLATAFSIIKRHDGYLTVESKVGDGTEFHLYLPASSNPIPQEDDTQPANWRGSGKILIMDDEEPVRQLACSMVSHFGYEPVAARNGEEAVIRYNQAKRSGQPFAAVIMDLTIPGGMGGREALSQLRMHDPNVRAIVSSGYSNDPVMARYREHGFSGVVEKPYTMEELGRVVHEVVHQPSKAGTN